MRQETNLSIIREPRHLYSMNTIAAMSIYKRRRQARCQVSQATRTSRMILEIIVRKNYKR